MREKMNNVSFVKNFLNWLNTLFYEKKVIVNINFPFVFLISNLTVLNPITALTLIQEPLLLAMKK